MAINDRYRLTVIGSLHGQTIMNVLHYNVITLGANPDASMAPAWLTANKAKWLACHSNEYTMESILVQKIHPAPTSLAVQTAVAAGVGTVAQNSLPTSVAAVLTKTTLFAGPRWRGRLYLSGVPETFESDSQISILGQTAYNVLGASLASVLVAGGNEWDPVLYHRDDHSVVILQTIVCRPVLRNQRRRQVGRGV